MKCYDYNFDVFYETIHELHAGDAKVVREKN